MVNVKSLLLAATAVAGTVASPAFAQQIPLPAPATADGALHGAGASSVQNVVARSFNCLSAVDNQRGTSTSATSLTTLTQGQFNGTIPINCALPADAVQTNVQGKYIATGSGFGRTVWADFANDFRGGTGPTVSSSVFNPFVTAPDVWSNVQFGFSDAGVSPADITTYNNRAAPSAGAAISFPLYLLPVAIAYSSTYGTNAAGQPMVFNARGRGIAPAGGTAAAAIKLSKAAYCGIFNGTLTNWNDVTFTVLNGNTPLFDTVNDNASRWAADGAPIRLVGRMDRSGTTDIFTRHLAAVCNPTSAPGIPERRSAPTATLPNGRLLSPAVPAFTGTNRFLQAAESLPYNTATGIDFRSVRSDTGYRVNNTSSTAFAGTVNSISGDYFTGTAIANIGTATSPTSAAGPTSMPTGSVGSGYFLLADGSSRVAAAITFAPDYLLNGVLLNGKVGYISADFVNPSVDALAGLSAATLQVGVSTTLYANPTAAAARTALGTILPPQSDTAGLFVSATADSRLVRPLTGSTPEPATRANPVAWADVLYADTNQSLARPNLGYPMTGTTQILLYTCYNGANREAMVSFLGWTLGQYRTKGDGTPAPNGLLNGVVAATPGVLFQNNIAVVPSNWTRAIVNTFLSNPTAETVLGAQNLWIQNRTIPAYQTATPDIFYGDTANGAPAASTRNPTTKIWRAARPNIRIATTPNPTCAGRTGA
jgi:phosphate transport system substrate-binding protein